MKANLMMNSARFQSSRRELKRTKPFESLTVQSFPKNKKFSFLPQNFWSKQRYRKLPILIRHTIFLNVFEQPPQQCFKQTRTLAGHDREKNTKKCKFLYLFPVKSQATFCRKEMRSLL